MEINKCLKEERIKNNITQEQLAEELGVSRQTISSWENGKSYPDIVSIIKLSDLYNISLDQLLKEDKQLINNMQTNMDVVKSNKSVIFYIIVGIILFGGIYALQTFVNIPKIDNLILNILVLVIFFISILHYLLTKLNVSNFLNKKTSNKTIIKILTAVVFIISLFGLFPLIDLFTNVQWQIKTIRVIIIILLAVFWFFIYKKIDKC